MTNADTMSSQPLRGSNSCELEPKCDELNEINTELVVHSNGIDHNSLPFTPSVAVKKMRFPATTKSSGDPLFGPG
mgnify:CR=1 FL=1